MQPSSRPPRVVSMPAACMPAPAWRRAGIVAALALLAAFFAAVLLSSTVRAQSLDGTVPVSGCYAVADERIVNNLPDDADTLFKLDTANGQPTLIGLTGTTGVEALAFGPNLALYTVDNGFLGTLDATTGAFTPLPNPLGTLNPPMTPNPPMDIDGLAYSPTRGLFFASVRRMLGNAPDLLFAIDPATGQIERDYFGAGTDYMVVQPVGIQGDLLHDIDDLALDPVNDVLYAAMNAGGAGGEFVRIDPATQTVTPLVQFRYPQNYPPDPSLGGQVIDDLEGLSFFNSGVLYGSTGGTAPLKDRNRLFQIDPATGVGVSVGQFPATHTDYEALACASAQAFVALEVLTNGPGQAPDDADTVPGPEITVGNTVTWTYRIVNTGSAPLTGFSLEDSELGALSCPPGDTVLDPGESHICTATGTAALGQYENTGTVTAHVVGDPSLTVGSSEVSHYFGVPIPGEGPGLELALLVNGRDADSATGTDVPRVLVGTTVTFTYIVTNTGDTNIGSLALNDDKLGDLGPAADCLPTGTVLAPNQAVTCTRTVTAERGLYETSATVTGVVPGSSPQVEVSRVDLGHYIGQEEDVVELQFVYLPLVDR